MVLKIHLIALIKISNRVHLYFFFLKFSDLVLLSKKAGLIF